MKGKCLFLFFLPFSFVVAQKNHSKKWWKEAIVYQIYPRSFKDSDGDGVGDLKGIISKVDYLQSLGINTIWLNPIYSSPNDDNGYDISDYRGIMKEFGTMEDFDILLKKLHQRKIKLVMDLVVNHSSDEHPWFKQSRSSRNSPYRNYYHWWNAERGKPPYRYSLFDVNHDAWKYDSLTNAYYLHYFSSKQPDLNWENPKLRQEIYDIMAFWAKKGIDGFRLDAFQFASKDINFPPFPVGFEKNFILYYAMGPHLHTYLKEMNKKIFSKYNLTSVAEGAGNSFQDAHNLVDSYRKELDMAYAFEGVDIAKPSGYKLLDFKKCYSRWDSAFAKDGWLSIFLANHDQARMVTRFGNDSEEFRELSSKMLTTFILTMRGTPYYYNGDELAMNNIRFDKIEDYKDQPTLNEYQYQKKIGGDLKVYIENLKLGCRDNGRTPFQWSSAEYAGFSTKEPWIKVNPNYTTVNVEKQEKDRNSPLNYFKKMVKLRKENPEIYAYTRELGTKKMLVVLNFSKNTVVWNFNFTKTAKVLLSNYSELSPQKNTIKPYQALICQL